MQKTIQLSKGKECVVDEIDYPILSAYSWHAVEKQPGKFYAVRTAHKGSPRCRYMHREILGLGRGEFGDHKNRNPLDNRRENLRRSTKQENQRNQPARSIPGKSSKYKGVYWNKRFSRWIARLSVDGKVVMNKTCVFEEDAARAYDQAAKKYFNEFACLNFPESEVLPRNTS